MAAPLDISPLSGPEEGARLALLLTVASPDTPPRDLFDGIASILNEGRSGSSIRGSQLQALVTERLQGRYPRQPLLHLAAGASDQAAEQLATLNLLVSAAPRPPACCSCGHAPLEPKLLRSAAFFYSEQHGPRAGRHYASECRECGTVHFLDGYEPEPGGPRRMNEDPALQHPLWTPAGGPSPSTETLISSALLERHLRSLHRAAVSFEAETPIYNDLHSPGGMRQHSLHPPA